MIAPFVPDPQWYAGLELADIYTRVVDGKRLSLEDGARLFACPDLAAVGALADLARRRLHGRTTHYVVNRHINYSNVCVNGCRFCAFGREAGADGTFELSVADVLEKLAEPGAEAITEIHIVGGCHPELPLSYYETLVREVKRLRPNLTVKAFTAVEIAHFADLAGVSTREVLLELRDAGVDMLPGGGAEVFSSRVRGLLCPRKLDGEGWLRVVGEAHQLGIKTNATMLYGHVETIEERLQHLLALRSLQDETGGFVCFIPLPFQPANTRVGKEVRPDGVDELKTMAVSRLMLDNIPHLKSYWVMLTAKLAQVALHFGADDLDGTVVEEKIGHMAGAQSEQALTRGQLERLIRQAGFEPVERDSFFRPVPPAPVHGE